MRKQKKKSRHSKQTHNRQYKDRLWRIVEQLFISDWDKRKTNMSNVTAYEKDEKRKRWCFESGGRRKTENFHGKKEFQRGN